MTGVQPNNALMSLVFSDTQKLESILVHVGCMADMSEYGILWILIILLYCVRYRFSLEVNKILFFFKF